MYASDYAFLAMISMFTLVILIFYSVKFTNSICFNSKNVHRRADGSYISNKHHLHQCVLILSVTLHFSHLFFIVFISLSLSLFPAPSLGVC